MPHRHWSEASTPTTTKTTAISDFLLRLSAGAHPPLLWRAFTTKFFKKYGRKAQNTLRYFISVYEFCANHFMVLAYHFNVKLLTSCDSFIVCSCSA